MLSKTMEEIFSKSRPAGWVLEPDAKSLFREAGFPVPRFGWVKNIDQLNEIVSQIGFPLAAKVVSPAIVHKSEVQGVALGLNSIEEITAFYNRFNTLPAFAGILVEEMAEGVELIVGAKKDHQFGPVILVGIGGTGVEVYQDVAIRMAPLSEKDIHSMLQELKGGRLLTGYRGKEAVNMKALSDVLLLFSNYLMEIAPVIESIDLNPLLCSARGCVIADARIILDNDNIRASCKIS